MASMASAVVPPLPPCAAGTPMRKKPAAPRRDHQVGIRGAVVEEAAWALTQARASSRLEEGVLMIPALPGGRPAARG
jgi:hypothetical protein